MEERRERAGEEGREGKGRSAEKGQAEASIFPASEGEQGRWAVFCIV